MSIIYDALKKVEKSNLVELPPGKTDKGDKHNYKAYLLYAAVIIFGILIANLSFRFLTKPKLSQAKAAPLPPAVAPIQVQGFKPAQKEHAAPLVLNGIFFSENEGYALVNNQIVKQGDSVAGATVVRITSNEVELMQEGSSVKLSTGAQ